jgi:hypothetical protein
MARRRVVEDRTRAGRGARQVVRAQRKDVLKRNWQLMAGGAGTIAVCVGVLVAIQDSAFGRGLTVGLGICVVAFFVWYPFVVSGVHTRGIGVDAERFTSQVLRKLDRRRWVVVDHVSFDRYDIDHVVVGPGRVFAVETKWRASPVERAQFAQLAARANKHAERLARLLRSEGAPATVTPLLVIWGPGSHAMTRAVEEIDGVKVVAGPRSKRWLRRLEASGNGIELNFPVVRALERYVERRDAYLERNGGASKVGS